MVLLLWGADVIPGDWYGTYGKRNVALLQRSETSAGFHYRDLALAI